MKGGEGKGGEERGREGGGEGEGEGGGEGREKKRGKGGNAHRNSDVCKVGCPNYTPFTVTHCDTTPPHSTTYTHTVTYNHIQSHTVTYSHNHILKYVLFEVCE